MFPPVAQAPVGFSKQTTRDMECAVCYEDNARCKLVCKHTFCHGCIKAWCQKGSGVGCPMCRRAVYFKGFHKKQEEWAEEAWENKTAELFGKAIDELVETTIEHKEEMPEFSRYFDGVLRRDLKNVDRTMRFLKSENVHEESIEDILYYEEYYSDRKIGAKNQGRERPRQKQHFQKQQRQQPRVPMRR